MTLLEAMYRGKVPTFCEVNLWNTEYAELVRQITEVETEILQTYPDIKPLLNRFQDIQNEINSISYYHEFQIGYKVGAQLMLEMMENITDTAKHRD